MWPLFWRRRYLGSRRSRLHLKASNGAGEASARPGSIAIWSSVDLLVAPTDSGAGPEPGKTRLEVELLFPGRTLGQHASVAEVVQLEGIRLQVVALHVGWRGVDTIAGTRIGHAIVLDVDVMPSADPRELAG